jgi:hypothetical protein
MGRGGLRGAQSDIADKSAISFVSLNSVSRPKGCFRLTIARGDGVLAGRIQR